MRYVIAGSGVAAFEAAQFIRKNSPDSEVAIFTAERVLPYRRPALPGLMSGTGNVQFFIKPDSFYQEENIEIHLGSVLVSIDRGAKRLSFADGSTSNYDKLLLALGAYCFVPPVAGAEYNGVCTLRSFADLENIRAALQDKNTTPVIIGGGLLGLELAEAIYKTCGKVTIVEGAPRLMPRQLTEEGSALAAEAIRSFDGVQLHLGVPPESIIADDKGKVKAVKLQDGREIPAGPVIFSTGIRPETKIAGECGLAVTPAGITVTDIMSTSDPDIFAAGDCAAVDGKNAPGLYLPARDMGIAAAHSMLEQSAPYAAKEYPPRFQGWGLHLVNGVISKIN